MSNIQAQIDALAVSIQVLDNTLSNVTGNTLSNYNQLSRIVAQQGNIYNTIYYGLGNMSTGNFTVNSNATVYGTSFFNGNVGVQRSNPAYALDVAGGANISGNILGNGNLTVKEKVLIGSDISTANLYLVGNAYISRDLFIGNLGTNRQTGVLLDVRNSGIHDTSVNGSISGNVFNQISIGERPWVFASDTTNSMYLYFGSQGGASPDPDFDFFFKKNIGLQIQPNTTGNTTDFTEALKVIGNANIVGNLTSFANILLPNGNIGIRTLNPLYPFDLAGSANISGNISLGENANILGNIGVSGNIIGTSNLIILNGNVGIRNSNPAYTVDVAGNINFTGNLYQNGIVFSGGGGGSSQWTTSGSNIYYNVANGNVGIGTSTPLYNLDIGGSANVSSNVYCMNMFVINDCLVQGGDFSIMNGNLTVYKRFNTFGESVLNGNLTVYNADFYNYGNTYVYDGLYVNKNGGLYTGSDAAGLHAFYAFDTVNLMSTLYGGADDTNRVGYFQARGYGGGLPLLLNPNGGNVGIGTGVPRATLSVSGNAVITGNVNIDNGLIWTDPVNNRVGINNTNPQYSLDVKGTANITSNLLLNGGISLGTNYGTSGQVLVSNGSSTLPSWASPITSGTLTTLSGTSVQFTSIPSWVKQITITINGLSTSSTGVPIIQLGNTGGYITTGYSGTYWGVNGAASGVLSTSIPLYNTTWAGTYLINGVATFYNMMSTSNTWGFQVSTGRTDVTNGYITVVNGVVPVTNTLDRIRLYIDGTQTFGAGNVNILYQ